MNNLSQVYQYLAPQEKKVFLQELDRFLREKRIARDTNILQMLAFLEDEEDTQAFETQFTTSTNL